MDEEHVRNPDLLDQTGIKGTTLVAAGGEGQAVVLPVMPQVQRHGEVLETRAKQSAQAQKSGRAGGESGNVSGAYHVNFRDAVDALNLDVDTNRKS